jgi:C-terminal processing protease CtpA/Prc
MIQPHATLRCSGPLVVLIDDRLQSSLEEMVFPIRLKGRARFVGSRTAGTAGNTAQITLPGATMFFTGTKPVYPDDRPFQNVGITPDVEVTATISGVRAGRDEVLEAGLDELRRMLGKV